MTPEPFDPTPTEAMAQAHTQVCLSAKHMRVAIGHLEAVDPELQRRLLAIQQTIAEVLNGMRS